jgi:ADP-ribose pyrophosphatase YjhB (NUDIX family)
MTNYTIGIYFTPDFKKVALILKNRPNWQKDKYNFPGGHVEAGEAESACISREFKEECNIITTPNEWKSIGRISGDNYKCFIFTAIYKPIHGNLKTGEDQPVSWVFIDKLPENCISNLYWLIPFAVNCWKQGNCDDLDFGIFLYKN